MTFRMRPRQHPVPVPGLHQTQRNDHVDLIGAAADGILCLKDLGLGAVIAVGKADDGADLQVVAHIVPRPLHKSGRDTHRGGVILQPLVAQGLHLLPGGGGGQQGMVHPVQDGLLIHFLIHSLRRLPRQAVHFLIPYFIPFSPPLSSQKRRDTNSLPGVV